VFRVEVFRVEVFGVEVFRVEVFRVSCFDDANTKHQIRNTLLAAQSLQPAIDPRARANS
jgi:hypothetical protein